MVPCKGVLLLSFHWNSHIIAFRGQTRNLELQTWNYITRFHNWLWE